MKILKCQSDGEYNYGALRSKSSYFRSASECKTRSWDGNALQGFLIFPSFQPMVQSTCTDTAKSISDELGLVIDFAEDNVTIMS